MASEGLKSDIKAAMEKVMSNGNKVELSGEIKVNLDVFADDMTEAIKRFLAAQTWEIVDLKAYLELEHFQTTGPILGDFIPTKIMSPGGLSPAPVFNPAGSSAIGPAGASVKINALTVTKKGGDIGDGSKLKSHGHAYIGSKCPKTGDTRSTGKGWNTFAKVRINYDKMKKDK